MPELMAGSDRLLNLLKVSYTYNSMYDKIYHKQRAENVDTNTLRKYIGAKDKLPQISRKDIQKKGSRRSHHSRTGEISD